LYGEVRHFAKDFLPASSDYSYGVIVLVWEDDFRKEMTRYSSKLMLYEQFSGFLKEILVSKAFFKWCGVEKCQD
jgi:hypothetical protein